MNGDTYFDLAGIGKSIVTAPLVLKAVDGGKLRLSDTPDRFFTDMPEERKGITATTGDVRCLGSDAAELAMKTTTGDIPGTILTMKI